MNTGEKRLVKISFPWNLYFKQLFSADTYVKFINPFSFWRRYRINHLETCKELNTVERLEDCYRLKRQLPKLTNAKQSRNYTDSLNNTLLEQTELNTIYISQPKIWLKYRGVSYYIRDVQRINLQSIALDPNLVKLNSVEQSPSPDLPTTSETSGSN